MSWQDTLRQASFKNFEFGTLSHSRSGGRKVKVHEFVGKDEPYVEDLGKVTATFSIDAFLHGDDYHIKRDDFIKVLEEKDPGVLIHPYLGRINASITEFELSEDHKEGKFCKFSLNFIYAGELKYPDSSLENSELIKSNVKASIAKSKKVFKDSYSVLNAPSEAVNTARLGVLKFTNEVKKKTELLAKTADAAANLGASLQQLENDVNNLVNFPDQLAEKLEFSISLIPGLSDDAEDISKTINDISTFSNFVPLSSASTTNTIETKNNDEFNLYIQRVSTANQVQYISDSTFSSREDLETEVFAAIENINRLKETADDEYFQLLQDSQAYLTNIIRVNSDSFTDTLNVKTNETLPSLLVLHNNNKSIFEEIDFINRNDISHPGFILSGTELEISNE
mgnify:CR=1 FL=1